LLVDQNQINEIVRRKRNIVELMKKESASIPIDILMQIVKLLLKQDYLGEKKMMKKRRKIKKNEEKEKTYC